MKKLSVKQENFIMALMSTSSTEEAFKKAGISQTTAYKYLNDPYFKEEYRRIRRETMQQVTSKLQQSALTAVETLNDIMTDQENSTPSSRVQAARVVLDNAYKGIELEDLEERIARLESDR